MASPRTAQTVHQRVRKDPGLAAIFSLVLPGVGQVYNGEFLRALFWFVVTPGFWIGTGGVFGWICHLVSAWTAHRRARVHNARLARAGHHL